MKGHNKQNNRVYDGWLSDEEDEWMSNKTGKPVAFVSRQTLNPPEAPRESGVIAQYSSSSWSSDAEEESESKKPPPLIPTQVAKHMQNTQMRSRKETLCDKGWNSSEDEQKQNPSKLSHEYHESDIDKHAADKLKSNYGVGYSLMSRMGLESKQLTEPVLLEQRDKKQGLTGVAKPKQQITATALPTRKRSRKEIEKHSSQSSDDECVIFSPPVVAASKSRRLIECEDDKQSVQHFSTMSQSKRKANMKGKNPVQNGENRSANSMRHLSSQSSHSMEADSTSRDEQFTEAERQRLEAKVSTLAKIESKLMELEDLLHKFTTGNRKNARNKNVIVNVCAKVTHQNDDDETCLKLGGELTVPADIITIESDEDSRVLSWLTKEFQLICATYGSYLDELGVSNFADRYLEKALECDLPSWNIREDPNWNLENLLFWRSLIVKKENQGLESVIKVVKPKLYRWFTYDWKPESECDLAMKLCDNWLKLFLSSGDYGKILTTNIVPRLITELRSGLSKNPNLWLLPWIPHVPKTARPALLEAIADTFLDCTLHGKMPLVSESEKIRPWNIILDTKQWQRIMYDGVLVCVRRWLMRQRPILSISVPSQLCQFMKAWRGEFPSSIISTMVTDIFAPPLFAQLTPTNDVLEGYAMWKMLRTEHVPELREFLTRLLRNLNASLQQRELS